MGQAVEGVAHCPSAPVTFLGEQIPKEIWGLCSSQYWKFGEEERPRALQVAQQGDGFSGTSGEVKSGSLQIFPVIHGLSGNSFSSSLCADLRALGWDLWDSAHQECCVSKGSYTDTEISPQDGKTEL